MESQWQARTPAAADSARAVSTRANFVGRERELVIGRAALEDALGGEGRLLLLAGEAGIGKSRFADELAAEARTRGARVLWGRCWEAGGAPAYWPWVQSIRAYVRARDPDALRSELGSGAGDLVQMLPELGDLYEDLEPSVSGDPQGARFRLFDSTARFLRAAAADRPLIVVLDDLHAADAPSLLLLRFVAGELGGSRILLVGAYRDPELGSGDPRVSALSELLRLAPTRLVRLAGVGPEAVSRYIEGVAGAEPSRTLVDVIHSQTEGNPLFFGELIRLLVSERRLEQAAGMRRLAMPASVREVIGRRLHRLSDECLGLLMLASALGRDFSVEALGAVSERDEGQLRSALDEASDDGVLLDVPDAMGQRRFGHALIRETLYEQLPPARRPALHRRCREALEQTYADDLEPHLAELAHHAFEAVPEGDPETAADLARRAGDRALGLLAFEEAARLYTMALGLLERRGHERCDLLLRLGDAQARAGDVPTAQSTFLAAAGLARELTLPEQLARAALGYGGRFVWEAGRGDRHLRSLLEEGLRLLGERDLTLRAMLLARLAGGPLREESDRTRRALMSEQAVELARRLADPATLAYVLDGRYAAIWWPDNLEQRLGVATELVRVAGEAGDMEREFQGRHYRCLALLELGQMAEVYAELEAQARLADELRQRAQKWYVTSVRATLATFEGRLSDAEALVERAFVLGRRAQGSMAPSYYTIQSYLLRREQGRLEEVEDRLKEAAAAFPTYRVLRCLLAHLHAELGRHAQARHALESLVGDDPARLGLDDEWIFSACVLADVAGFLGDEPSAAALYDALLPYAPRNAGSNPDGCIGSVSRPLGVLASTLRRFDQAERHFEDALELNERSGSRPWVAQTRLDWARAQLARDAPGDRERAGEHVAAALQTARELGAAALEGKASELLGGLRVEAPGSRASEPIRVFRREGEYWAIAFDEDHFRLRDTKGLRYLADLLAHPGLELSALSLAAEVKSPGPALSAHALAEEGVVASGTSGAGEVLDEEARIAYARRRNDLRDEIDEAERFNDPERVARAREEIEALTSQLAAAAGLGGRTRSAPGPAERARQSVTKAIKAAIARISDHSPALASHLTRTIRTGAACSYRVEPGETQTVWKL